MVDFDALLLIRSLLPSPVSYLSKMLSRQSVLQYPICSTRYSDISDQLTGPSLALCCHVVPWYIHMYLSMYCSNGNPLCFQ
jgi:hypothetical protein